jgi:hypothetical protein
VPLGNVAIVILTGDEVHLCNLNAEKHVRAEYKRVLGEVPKESEMTGAFLSVYNTRATREILSRSCKKADQCTPDARGVCLVDHSALTAFFPTAEAVGKLITDEQAVLMRHYLQTQAEVGPIMSDMSQFEMDAWIEVLGKGGSSAPLASLSSEQASALVMYMASRLCDSPTDSSSPGTPPENDT